MPVTKFIFFTHM